MNLLKKYVFVRCFNSIKRPSEENDDITFSKLAAQHVIYLLCQQKTMEVTKMWNYQTFANRKVIVLQQNHLQPKDGGALQQDVTLLLHEMLNFGEYEFIIIQPAR